MLSKSIPASVRIETIPAHTEHAYEFGELTQDQQELIAIETCEQLLECDMENEEFNIAMTFPRSDIHLQWDASHTQGSGANVYGTFSINDLLEYAGLDPIEDDWQVTFKPNRDYTYCRWDEIYYGDDLSEAVLEHYEEWLDSQTAYDSSGLAWASHEATVFWETWEKRIKEITHAMSRLCRDAYDYMEYLQFDWYYSGECYEDQLFDSDGTFLCMTWEW